MERFLDFVVKNNETTSDRKAQLLAKINSVARGEMCEYTCEEIKITPTRVERSITVDLCVYRVVEVNDRVDVHFAVSNSKVENVSKGSIDAVNKLVY